MRTLVHIPGSSAQSLANQKKSNNNKIKSVNRGEDKMYSLQKIKDYNCGRANGDQSFDINSISCKNHRFHDTMASVNNRESSLWILTQTISFDSTFVWNTLIFFNTRIEDQTFSLLWRQ